MKTLSTMFPLLLFILIIPISGYSQDYSDPADAVKERLQEMAETVKAKDLDAFGNYWMDDAMLKFTGKPALQGKQAIKEAHAPMMEQGMYIEAETKEVFTAEDLATEIGSYKILSPDGTVVDYGLYSTLWKNNEGQWYILRDVISSSVSPEEPTK